MLAATVIVARSWQRRADDSDTGLEKSARRGIDLGGNAQRRYRSRSERLRAAPISARTQARHSQRLTEYQTGAGRQEAEQRHATVSNGIVLVQVSTL